MFKEDLLLRSCCAQHDGTTLCALCQQHCASARESSTAAFLLLVLVQGMIMPVKFSVSVWQLQPSAKLLACGSAWHPALTYAHLCCVLLILVSRAVRKCHMYPGISKHAVHIQFSILLFASRGTGHLHVQPPHNGLVG